MNASLVTALAAVAQDRPPLIGPGRLAAPLGLARAQIGARATALGPDGTIWQEFAADAPRFHGLVRRLKVEGQRTNAIRNPRFEGAVPGTPGTFPTFMTPNTDAGLTRSVVGVGSEFGLPFFDVRWSGTASFNFLRWRLEPPGTGGVAATVGQLWAYRVPFRVLAGSSSGLTFRLVLTMHDAAGAQSGAYTSALIAGGAAVSDMVLNTPALPFANTAFINVFADILMAVGTVMDVTVRYYAPQLEQGAFASSPILPAVGTPAASTRGADLVSAPLAGMQIGSQGRCTILWSGSMAQAAPASAGASLLEVDDGTPGNRLFARIAAGTANLAISRVTGGVGVADLGLGATVPGVPFRAGFALNGAGRIAGSLEGGAVQAVTGGPAAGLTTLRLGLDAAGGSALFGEIGTLRVLPYALSDAALPGAVLALPV
jgi:hypothetical protein